MIHTIINVRGQNNIKNKVGSQIANKQHTPERVPKKVIVQTFTAVKCFSQSKQNYIRVSGSLTYHHPAINLRLLPSHKVTDRYTVALDNAAPMMAK